MGQATIFTLSALVDPKLVSEQLARSDISCLRNATPTPCFFKCSDPTCGAECPVLVVAPPEERLAGVADSGSTDHVEQQANATCRQESPLPLFQEWAAGLIATDALTAALAVYVLAPTSHDAL